MTTTPQHFREILRHVRDGKSLGGGDAPLLNLQDEIDRLLTLRLIEVTANGPYLLTEIGAQVLDALH